MVYCPLLVPRTAGGVPFVVPPLGGCSPGFRLKPVLRTSATSSGVRHKMYPAIAGHWVRGFHSILPSSSAICILVNQSELAMTSVCAKRRTVFVAIRSGLPTPSLFAVKSAPKAAQRTAAIARQGSGVRPNAAHAATSPVCARMRAYRVTVGTSQAQSGNRSTARARERIAASTRAVAKNSRVIRAWTCRIPRLCFGRRKTYSCCHGFGFQPIEGGSGCCE